MKAKDSIVMIGAPESGKTNYLGRFWRAVQDNKSKLRATQTPDDIRYVNYALSYLLQGEFAPRSEKNAYIDDRHCLIQLAWQLEGSTKHAELLVPDVSGELWEQAVQTNELPKVWMDRLRQSIGALLFICVASSVNRPSLDWVTARDLLEIGGAAHDTPREGLQIPTDVELCEFLRFLELALGKDTDVVRPRVAVLVAAWDLVDDGRAQHGPKAYLSDEFPLFAGRLEHVSTVEVEVFGVSVVSGDFDDHEFKTRYFEGSIDQFGYVVIEPGTGPHPPDVTIPVRWVLDGKSGR